jgi:hypothetical protein
MQVRLIIPAVFALVALVAPAAAGAASKPAVTTGGVANITPTTAQLNGKVDANGADTAYFFEIGTTTLYGTRTAAVAIGSGTSPKGVSAAVGGLAPATRYHYRLVAQNRLGVAKGADRTFKTKVQPLGLVLAANPPAVAPGGSTTLAGQLTGTNRAGRQVVLQRNAFPYTAGFANAANAQVTDANGNFAFAILAVPVTTQFRVLMPSKPEIASPIVVVGAALQVKTRIKKVKRHRHSVSVRFRGSVTPESDGKRVSIQKLRAGVWTEIAHTHAVDAGASKSRFRTRVRLFRSGSYRVVAVSDGAFVSGAGRTLTIHVRH